LTAKATELAAKRAAEWIDKAAEAAKESAPKVAGTANDPSFSIRGAILAGAKSSSGPFKIIADAAEWTVEFADAAKEITEAVTDLYVLKEEQDFEVFQKLLEVEKLVRNEAALRLEVFTQMEVVQQTAGRYLAALAEGERVLDELIRFRRAAAASVTEHRYRDMTFRIFRNDALAKYRSAFDLAARY